jgi:hypothetical protein
VALVAQGFTNGEMAEKMFISERTVTNLLPQHLRQTRRFRPARRLTGLAVRVVLGHSYQIVFLSDLRIAQHVQESLTQY